MGSSRGQVAAAACVFALALVLRVPFVSHYLWAWDSVLYAEAMASFDVSAGHPHPPGYLFYILLARLVAFGGDPANAALVTISALAGAGTVAAGLVIGWRLRGPLVGALTAAILIADPLLWQYSEVAYPYTLLALLAGVLGALLWWSSGGSARRTVVASLAVGLAAGFRQDLLLVLWPLWLWSTLRHGPRAVAASVLAAGASCLVWLVPSALFSGGSETYLAQIWGQLIGISPLSGGSSTIAENLLLLLVGLRWQLLWVLPLAVLGGIVLLRRRDPRGAIVPLLLWTLPAALTYLLLHIGEWAYTLSVAVPLALLAAVGGAAFLEAARSHLIRVVAATVVAVLLVLNAQSFVFGEGRFSARAIAGHDKGLAIWISHLRAEYPAARTVLLARESYLHARYYLPEYQVIYVPPRAAIALRRLGPLRPGIDQAVLFLGEVVAREGTTSPTVRLASGVAIGELSVPQGSGIFVEDRFVLVGEDPSARPP